MLDWIRRIEVLGFELGIGANSLRLQEFIRMPTNLTAVIHQKPLEARRTIGYAQENLIRVAVCRPKSILNVDENGPIAELHVWCVCDPLAS